MTLRGNSIIISTVKVIKKVIAHFLNNRKGLYFLYLLLFISCSNQFDTSIQEFTINNKVLDSLSGIFTNATFDANQIRKESNKESGELSIPLLIFAHNDSVISCSYTYKEMSKVSEFIKWGNYRLLGYCNNTYKCDIILLVSFESSNYKDLGKYFDLVLPTERVKIIPYLFTKNFKYKYDFYSDSNSYMPEISWDDNTVFCFYYYKNRFFHKKNTFPILPKTVSPTRSCVRFGDEN